MIYLFLLILVGRDMTDCFWGNLVRAECATVGEVIPQPEITTSFQNVQLSLHHTGGFPEGMQAWMYYIAAEDPMNTLDFIVNWQDYVFMVNGVEVITTGLSFNKLQFYSVHGAGILDCYLKFENSNPRVEAFQDAGMTTASPTDIELKILTTGGTLVEHTVWTPGDFVWQDGSSYNHDVTVTTYVGGAFLAAASFSSVGITLVDAR